MWVRFSLFVKMQRISVVLYVPVYPIHRCVLYISKCFHRGSVAWSLYANIDARVTLTEFHSRESAKSTVNKINEMEKENIKSTTYLFNDSFYVFTGITGICIGTIKREECIIAHINIILFGCVNGNVSTTFFLLVSFYHVYALKLVDFLRFIGIFIKTYHALESNAIFTKGECRYTTVCYIPTIPTHVGIPF